MFFGVFRFFFLLFRRKWTTTALVERPKIEHSVQSKFERAIIKSVFWFIASSSELMKLYATLNQQWFKKVWTFEMISQQTNFYINFTNFVNKFQLRIVFIAIVVLYIFLTILWRQLLQKSQRDHAFGESFLSERQPKMVKVKLI